MSQQAHLWPIVKASLPIHLGEKDQALKWLEAEYRTRGTGICALKVDPTWDPLRADPRFQDLLRRAGFRQ